MHYNLVERKHEPSGFLRTVGVAMAQFPRFDLVISNGRLCDPAGGTKRRADTAKGLYVTASLVDLYPTAAHSGVTASRMQGASASLADWRIPEVHSRAGKPEIDPVKYFWSFMKRTGETVISTRRWVIPADRLHRNTVQAKKQVACKLTIYRGRRVT
jgi:hypothetical protein